MKLFRVKVPIVIEMVFDEDEVKGKTAAIEQMISICGDDPDIVTDTMREVDESLVSYEETDTWKAPL